jgi:hypothetical protein
LGFIKKCYPILKVAMFCKIENQVKIPVEAVVLHNIIRSLKGGEQWLEDQPENVQGNVVELPDGDQAMIKATNKATILETQLIDYQQHRNK